MAYTTQTNIENYLKRSLTSEESGVLTIILTTVDEFINHQLGGTGWGSVSETTRYYDGGISILDIDPCFDITAIKSVDIGEDELYDYDLDEDLEERPRNETIKKYIQKRDSKFPRGVANIAVTAKFSRGATTPNEIIWLATYLAAKLFNENLKNGVKKESIEGYSREFVTALDGFSLEDKVVKDILAKYQDDEILV